MHTCALHRPVENHLRCSIKCPTDQSLGRFCFYCILQTCYSWSEATIWHNMRMQTICKYTANADLLMLFACRTACLHVWMMWHAGWLLTSCSSITPSPKCSGAHQNAVSTRSQVMLFISEAQPYNLYPLYATLGLCWMLRSPWARMSEKRASCCWQQRWGNKGRLRKKAIEIVDSRMKSPIHSVTEVAQVEDDKIQTKQ